jgi:hypothetical protein
LASSLKIEMLPTGYVVSDHGPLAVFVEKKALLDWLEKFEFGPGPYKGDDFLPHDHPADY